MPLSGQQVLVTGATGFLGGTLALKLADQGARVRALVRSPKKAQYLRSDIEVAHGDITDAEAVSRAVDGCSVVYHVAAAFDDVKTQLAVNLNGTRNIATAAGEAGVKRLVHVSTIAVYGNNYTVDVTEDMPLAPGAFPYAVTKAQAETIVREVCARYGMSYTIIRPGMIYGPRSAMWTKLMFELARRNPTPWLGDGHGSMYPIYIDDVVDLLFLCGDHPAAANQAFNATPDPSPTWREYIQKLSRLAGHENWLAIPPVIGYAIGGIVMLVSPPLSVGRDLPDLLKFTQTYITIKNGKARDLLGWQPQISLDEGVARSADYLREIGLLK